MLTETFETMNTNGPNLRVKGVRLSAHFAACGINCTDFQGWTKPFALTHIPTGMLVAPVKMTATSAKRLAASIEPTRWWEFTTISGFHADPEGNRKAWDMIRPWKAK